MASTFPLLIVCVLLTLWTSKCCGNSFVTVNANVNVDILCMKGTYGNHWIVSYARNNLKSRTWCGDWHKYLDLLNVSTVYNQETLVILPSYMFKQSLIFRLVVSKVYQFPLTTWILIAGRRNPPENGTWPSELYCEVVVVWEHNASIPEDRFWNCKRRRIIGKRQLMEYLLRRENRTSKWKRLSARPIKLGCNSDVVSNASCREKKMTVIKKVFKALNVTFKTVSVGDDAWMEQLMSKWIDVLDANIVLSEYRRAYIYYPAYLFHVEVVYYVRGTATRYNSIRLNSSLTEFLALLVASAVVCLTCLCFINHRQGRPLGSDLASSGMVLVAAVLGFPYPIAGPLERSTLARTILFCWMMGGTSLGIFFQSLLTSSASHGVYWEADNTQDKLIPNLDAGAVSVCVERPFIHGSLLEQRVNDSDFLGHMARAFRRNPTTLETADECFDLVMKKTHVFLTYEHDLCELEKYGARIVRGKETMHPTFGGTPVRKDFPLRHELEALSRRLVETGLREAAEKEVPRSFVEEPDNSTVPLDVRQFIALYLAGCVAAVMVLVLEWLPGLYRF